MLDVKRIKYHEVEYEINVDQLPGLPEVIAEYLMAHAVTVLLEGRYQVDGGCPEMGDSIAWRLLDWKVLSVSLDGQVLDHDERVPSDFPMAIVINSTYSRHTREYLEARPPEEE
tara:strand:+ start:182 stop:523 length:342 start_codon:yes stop_codon:yes gene_type:complete